MPYCRGARVVEAGCGEGYGAALVAGVARAVLAMDYDLLAASHAARRYRQLCVIRANLVALPVATASVDVVVGLQVIEHLWDQPRFLAECARVLRAGGTLILSTPNRLTFSPGWIPGTPPLNPFHTRELAASELTALLPPTFHLCDLRGLKHGARLHELDARYGGLVAAQLTTTADRWPATLLADVSAVQAADFVTTDDDVDTALDLLLVARRRSRS
ncbi:MAG: class I SAM-dependent methyltransferase [Geodermatophilaceae bacterium]